MAAQVRTVMRGDVAVIGVHGEFDIVVAGPFREAVVALVRAGCRGIVADLSAVSFVDATGLGALVGGSHAVATQGGRLCLVVTTGPVRKVLRIAGYGRLFEVHDTLAEALTCR
jgi:anti-sigma B factor antagonist